MHASHADSPCAVACDERPEGQGLGCVDGYGRPVLLRIGEPAPTRDARRRYGCVRLSESRRRSYQPPDSVPQGACTLGQRRLGKVRYRLDFCTYLDLMSLALNPLWPSPLSVVHDCVRTLGGVQFLKAVPPPLCHHVSFALRVLMLLCRCASKIRVVFSSTRRIVSRARRVRVVFRWAVRAEELVLGAAHLKFVVVFSLVRRDVSSRGCAESAPSCAGPSARSSGRTEPVGGLRGTRRRALRVGSGRTYPPLRLP